MITPEEYYVRVILPEIKAYIISIGVKRGFKLSEIARRLGISPTAASKLYRRRLKVISRYLDYIKNDLDRVTESVLSLGYTPSEYIKLLHDLWITWLTKGIFHREIVSLLKRHTYSSKAEELYRYIINVYSEDVVLRAYREVEEAFKIFSSISNIAKYIPLIGTNIVRLIEVEPLNGDYPVIGYPGRINVVDDKVIVYSTPKIGGSAHMANIVRELFKKSNCMIKGLTGIGFNNKLYNVIKERYLNEYEEFRIDSDLELLNRVSGFKKIIIDLGGFGREGFIYVSGYNSIDAVNRLKKIIESVEDYA